MGKSNKGNLISEANSVSNKSIKHVRTSSNTLIKYSYNMIGLELY